MEKNFIGLTAFKQCKCLLRGWEEYNCTPLLLPKQHTLGTHCGGVTVSWTQPSLRNPTVISTCTKSAFLVFSLPLMVISQKVFYQAVLDTVLKSCYRLDSGYSKALLGLPEGRCVSLGSVISKQSGPEQLKWEPRTKEDNTADSLASESTETLTQEQERYCSVQSLPSEVMGFHQCSS